MEVWGTSPQPLQTWKQEEKVQDANAPGPRPCLLPLRLMTSLVKRSDIRSPAWPVALTATGKPQVREEKGTFSVSVTRVLFSFTVDTPALYSHHATPALGGQSV